MPRKLLFAALVPLLGALLMFGFLHRFARSMIYPGSPVPFPADPELARLLPQARKIDYRAADGIALRGVLVPAVDPAGPVAVYFHGNAESAAQNLPFAWDLAKRGIGVFLAEYRGYGGLEGEPTEDGLYADGDAAVEAVLQAGIRPERLILMGRSLGTGVATELAVRHPCALLVLISPYTSMVDMGRGIAGPAASLAVPDRYDNLGKIARVCCPVVILHGTRDEVIPVTMGRALAAAAPGSTFIEVAGASHNDFPELEDLVARETRKVVASPNLEESPPRGPA